MALAPIVPQVGGARTAPAYEQGRSDGGYNIGIYNPQNQSTLQIFMWLLVVFLFDPEQIVVDLEIGMTS